MKQLMPELRGTRGVIIWSMMVGIMLSALAFGYKISEFIFTMNSPGAQGFADVPIVIYFFVAAGWLCLLVWCLITGKFENIEREKIDLLVQEDEYARLGI